MEQQMVDAVVDAVEKKGFTGVELGFAAVGVAAVGIGMYNIISAVRGNVKDVKNLGADFVAGMEDLEKDPKFKKVRETFAKETVDKKMESKEAC
jgi:hypothetical protein